MATIKDLIRLGIKFDQKFMIDLIVEMAKDLTAAQRNQAVTALKNKLIANLETTKTNIDTSVTAIDTQIVNIQDATEIE